MKYAPRLTLRKSLGVIFNVFVRRAIFLRLGGCVLVATPKTVKIQRRNGEELWLKSSIL